jgi:Ca2+/Na+ antiporter
MTKPTEQVKQVVNVAAELKRIISSGALAFLLLMLAVLLDGPVSILAWMLLAVAFLCLAYVVLASRQLLVHFRSQENKVDPHE